MYGVNAAIDEPDEGSSAKFALSAVEAIHNAILESMGVDVELMVNVGVRQLMSVVVYSRQFVGFCGVSAEAINVGLTIFLLLFLTNCPSYFRR